MEELGFTYENFINLVGLKKTINRSGPRVKKHNKKMVPLKIKYEDFDDHGYYLFCRICQCTIQKRIRSQHLRSIKHKNNKKI